MPKKAAFLLALALFSVIFGYVGTAGAQLQEPNDCCKLRADVSFTRNGVPVKFEKGNVIGPSKGSPWCDINNDGNSGDIEVTDDEWALICLVGTVNTLTNWLFYILTLFVVVMIIIGGFTFVTASGDPNRASKGRAILTYAAIGLAIALLAKIIPSIVKFIVGL